MNYSEDEYNRAKTDMLGEFNRAISAAEALLRSVTVATAAAAKVGAGTADEPGIAGDGFDGTSAGERADTDASAVATVAAADVDRR